MYMCVVYASVCCLLVVCLASLLVVILVVPPYLICVLAHVQDPKYDATPAKKMVSVMSQFLMDL